MPFIQEHLQRRRNELQEQYDFLSEQISRLRNAYAIEADVTIRFKLEKQIEQTEAERDGIVEDIEDIEARLAALNELMTTHFGNLTRSFAGTSPGIYNHILDYTGFIEEKTRGFVGRQFVFDMVDQFVQANPRGYFFIRGDPGIGKSALAAQMVKTNGYIHHFNIRAEGINKASNFLTNVCAQLIAAYDLDHTALPPEAIQDAGFLTKLLGQVSDRLSPDEKVIIVVDALDEVDTVGLAQGVNPLYLPLILPQGTYMVATSRKVDKVKLRIECEQAQLFIEQNSDDNIADIRQYVEQAVEGEGIQAYIVARGIDNETFVTHLVNKSQGNFMYLRYVLPEIERGAYKDLELAAIPVGLQNYYDDHWRRMRGQDEEAWFKYKLPVVVALTVVKEPVSIDLIADFSKVQERPRIRAVLREWAQFLYEEQVEHEGGWQKRYRIYHASFHDFIASKEEVADERVDLKAGEAQIADDLWDELFGDE